METLHVGLLATGLDTYWAQFDGLLDALAEALGKEQPHQHHGGL